MAERVTTENKIIKLKLICPRFSWKEIKERKLKLRTFIIVLSAVSTIMTYSLGSTIVRSMTTNPEGPSCFYPIPETNLYFKLITPLILNQFIIALMYPITGWLADTIIGRSKAVKIGVWCCWLGSVLYTVSFLIQYGFCGLPVNIAKYGISLIALIFINIGTIMNWANIPSYGQDQLVNKSSNQIRAFIHWIIWGMYLGQSLDFMYFIHDVIYRPVIVLIIGLVIFLFNSIVLILFGTFHHKFKPSGVLKKNPYKSIYEVLKYAVQHKSPTNRSSMTYWEHTAPSRIDLGKKKYGGPFTEDEVEDVKVFWRILGTIFSTFGIHFSRSLALNGIFNYMNTFYGAINFSTYFFWSFFHKSILMIVPVMHFIIIPLVPKIDYFLIKSLRNLGALHVLMIIGMISLIIITIVGKGLPFASTSILNVSYYWFAIPLLLNGLVGSFRNIFTLEFIISQAPANMSGMLMAGFWSFQAIISSLGTFTKIPFTFDNPKKQSYYFWVFSINLLVLIVGFVVYIVCAWKYKRRRRDDGYYCQNVIEDTYTRILDREEMVNNSDSHNLLVKIDDSPL